MYVKVASEMRKSPLLFDDFGSGPSCSHWNASGLVRARDRVPTRERRRDNLPMNVDRRIE
jgi:hypothetical protein